MISAYWKILKKDRLLWFCSIGSNCIQTYPRHMSMFPNHSARKHKCSTKMSNLNISSGLNESSLIDHTTTSKNTYLNKYAKKKVHWTYNFILTLIYCSLSIPVVILGQVPKWVLFQKKYKHLSRDKYYKLFSHERRK